MIELTLMNYVILPASIYIVLFLLITFIGFSQKSNLLYRPEENKTNNFNIFFQYILISFVLIGMNIFYSLTVYNLLQQSDVELVNQIKNTDLQIFLGAISITIFLCLINYFVFLKKIINSGDKKQKAKDLTLSILGYTVIEIISIGGLVYIFNIFQVIGIK